MKDFDIDKLERKNIYTAPENFFSEMQANVLQQTIPQKKGRIISLNWAYAAAAAVALIFSSTFLVGEDEPQTEFVAQKATNTEALPVAEPKEATIAYKTLAEDLTSVTADNQKVNAAPPKIVAKAKTEKIETPRVTAPAPEVQVDQILANITSAELAVLARNVEQDVYLDLYY